MTLTTHASPRKMPCQTSPVSHQGAPMLSNQLAAAASTAKNALASICDGMFAPRIVTQNTAPSSSSMTGSPSHREVTMRSIRWSKSHLPEPCSRTDRPASSPALSYRLATM